MQDYDDARATLAWSVITFVAGLERDEASLRSHFIYVRELGDGSNKNGRAFQLRLRERRETACFDAALKNVSQLEGDTLELEVMRLCTWFCLNRLCPNLPVAYGTFTYNAGDPFEVYMLNEFQDGETLKQWMLETGPHQADEWRSMFAQTLLGLAFLELPPLRLEHRDLQWTNVLSCCCDPGGVWHYQVDGIDLYVPNYGRIWRVFDFGLGCKAPESMPRGACGDVENLLLGPWWWPGEEQSRAERTKGRYPLDYRELRDAVAAVRAHCPRDREWNDTFDVARPPAAAAVLALGWFRTPPSKETSIINRGRPYVVQMKSL